MLTQRHGYALAAGLLKRKLPHIQIGRICLGIDIIVIILYAVAFQSLTNALYAGIELFISSFAMDAVIYGRRTSKVAVIITERGEILSVSFWNRIWASRRSGRICHYLRC